MIGYITARLAVLLLGNSDQEIGIEAWRTHVLLRNGTNAINSGSKGYNCNHFSINYIRLRKINSL